MKLSVRLNGQQLALIRIWCERMLEDEQTDNTFMAIAQGILDSIDEAYLDNVKEDL